MATETVPGSAPSAPAIIPAQVGELFTQARAAAISRAGREILALAQAAQAARKHGRDIDDPDMLLESVLLRVELLGSCIGVLTDAVIDAEEIGIQYQLVFHRPMEVSHA